MRAIGLALAGMLLVAAAACSKEGTAPPVKGGRTMADSAEQVMFSTLHHDRGVPR